jgi:hypothetical protein
MADVAPSSHRTAGSPPPRATATPRCVAGWRTPRRGWAVPDCAAALTMGWDDSARPPSRVSGIGEVVSAATAWALRADPAHVSRNSAVLIPCFLTSLLRALRSFFDSRDARLTLPRVVPSNWRR